MPEGRIALPKILCAASIRQRCQFRTFRFDYGSRGTALYFLIRKKPSFLRRADIRPCVLKFTVIIKQFVPDKQLFSFFTARNPQITGVACPGICRHLQCIAGCCAVYPEFCFYGHCGTGQAELRYQYVMQTLSPARAVLTKRPEAG
jgi:hypothetical protein